MPAAIAIDSRYGKIEKLSLPDAGTFEVRFRDGTLRWLLKEEVDGLIEEKSFADLERKRSVFINDVVADPEEETLP